MDLLGTKSMDQLTLIKQNDPNGTLVSKCEKLLDYWKQGKAKSECRWEDVIGLLNNFGFKALAEELAEALSGGTEADSRGKRICCISIIRGQESLHYIVKS